MELAILNGKRIAVIGDIHGDIEALEWALSQVRNDDLILFLGDYADKGKYGVEVIRKVNSLLERDNVIALKGNHEDYTKEGNPLFAPCTLHSEVIEKGMDWKEYFQNELKPFISKLYLAAVLPDDTLFVHGGISSKINSLNDLKNPTREIEIDVLWSDPYNGIGEVKNPRGAGVLFGRDITENICKKLNVGRIVRGHEPRKVYFKPFLEHSGKVITTATTSVYDRKPVILFIQSGKMEFKV